jgi:hypothetical protein
MHSSRTNLPAADQTGAHGQWDVVDRDGVLHEISGQFLGLGSTHRPHHKGHPDETFAPRRVHCSTCRWTEVYLFHDVERDSYAVAIMGASDVPDERDLIRVAFLESPLEVIEHLTVFDRSLKMSVIYPHARRALAQAADRDERMRWAYMSSPVTRP